MARDSSLVHHSLNNLVCLICLLPKTSRQQPPSGWVGNLKGLLASVFHTTSVVDTCGRGLGVCGTRSKRESGGTICSGSCFDECGAGMLMAVEETGHWALSLSLLHNQSSSKGSMLCSRSWEVMETQNAEKLPLLIVLGPLWYRLLPHQFEQLELRSKWHGSRAYQRNVGPRPLGGGCTGSSILIALAYLIFSLYCFITGMCGYSPDALHHPAKSPNSASAVCLHWERQEGLSASACVLSGSRSQLCLPPTVRHSLQLFVDRSLGKL